MAEPVVTPTDLANYLGVEAASIDEDRANLFINGVMGLCRLRVDPVPANASLIVLRVAARGYASPVPTSAIMAGPYQMSGSFGGVSLTKTDKADLRLAAGRGGASSLNMLPSCYTADESSSGS